MVLVQFVINSTISVNNLALGNLFPVSQTCYHSLAGRRCSISILTISMAHTASDNSNRLMRVDFVGLQPTDRMVLESSSASLDESSLAYGFVFPHMQSGTAALLYTTNITYSTPPTFTAYMNTGNRFGIRVTNVATLPDTPTPGTVYATLSYFVMTLDIHPID
jgi:hypothetical protein